MEAWTSSALNCRYLRHSPFLWSAIRSWFGAAGEYAGCVFIAIISSLVRYDAPKSSPNSHVNRLRVARNQRSNQCKFSRLVRSLHFWIKRLRSLTTAEGQHILPCWASRCGYNCKCLRRTAEYLQSVELKASSPHYCWNDTNDREHGNQINPDGTRDDTDKKFCCCDPLQISVKFPSPMGSISFDFRQIWRHDKTH